MSLAGTKPVRSAHVQDEPGVGGIGMAECVNKVDKTSQNKLKIKILPTYGSMDIRRHWKVKIPDRNVQNDGRKMGTAQEREIAKSLRNKPSTQQSPITSNISFDKEST